MTRRRILIAPLDWGLGHATRCIPIIKELISLKCEVYIAADKQIFALLKKEFPRVEFLSLKGYGITYSRNKKSFAATLFLQFPKILGTILYEHFWLKKTIKNKKIDAVISDNRFGFYNKKIPSVYITHQLFIETGNTFCSRIASKIHSFFIKKYTKCWVPDFEENGLAGKLSHPGTKPANVSYIGGLSRFEILPEVQRKYNLFFLISGPEPQRSIFEKTILEQIRKFEGTVLIARGIPAEKKELVIDNKLITVRNHLSSSELNIALQQSDLVICRSGYTTIMDLVKLKKPAVLIPTPGQKEQEYLAKYLSEKKYFHCMNQEDFSVEEAIEKSLNESLVLFNLTEENYKIAVNEFVLSLKTGNFAP